MERLRDSLPDLPIGLSSFRYPKLHRTFPWEVFLEHCDLNMPQVYWFRTPPADSLARSIAEFTEIEAPRKPIFPTGAAYTMEGGIPATPGDITAFLQAAREDQGLAGAC